MSEPIKDLMLTKDVDKVNKALKSGWILLDTIPTKNKNLYDEEMNYLLGLRFNQS